MKKKLIIALMLTFLSHAALSSERSGTKKSRNPEASIGLDMEIPPDQQKCERFNGGSFPRWIIVKKLRKNVYEMAGLTCMGYECGKTLHGLLITTTKEYTSGGDIWLNMKKIGNKSLPLENGFSSIYTVWKECEGGAE